MKKYSKLPKYGYEDNEITGIVEIWGKIITAKHGYRAEYGQLRALVNAPAVVSETYGVPNLPSYEYASQEYFS